MFRYKLIRVSGNSMFPTLKNGDILIVKKYRNLNLDLDSILKKGIIKKNDLIVFKDPISLKNLFIKRVIGIPDETIQLKENGTEYEWILKNEYVVLGDNREESVDSRRFGPINASLIIGKILIKIWPLF